MELKNREKLSNSEPILPSDTLSSPSTSSTFALTNTHKVLLVVGAAFITLLLVLMTVDIKGEESESTIVESKIIYHFQLAKIFTSNMVLPRAPFRAKLWGWCDAPTCAVNITFNNRTYLADVDSYPDSNDLFRWETKLPRTEEGGPYSIIVSSGAAEMRLKNILFGDIYLCSGQSNMQFSLPQSFEYKKELEVAPGYSKIRLYTVGESSSDHELADFSNVLQSWSMPSAASLGGADDFSYFSAVCWHFGRNLFDRHKIPIGLIVTAANGTPIQPWLPESNAIECADTEPPLYEVECCPSKNSVTFNSYIAPIKKLQITAVLWYQGESNIFDHDYYPCAMKELVKGWRTAFGNNFLPFFYVQLHPFLIQYTQDDLARFRITQLALLDQIDNIYMASAVDLGDIDSPYDPLHPRNKKEVGLRLEKLVSSVVYNDTAPLPSGPIPKSAKLLNTVKPNNDTEADHLFTVQVQFREDTVQGSLILREVSCFEPLLAWCGYQYEIYFENDDVWVPGSGFLHFDRISLYISAPYHRDGRPTKVRYAYGSWPIIGVYNTNDLPCSPFLLDVAFNYF